MMDSSYLTILALLSQLPPSLTLPLLTLQTLPSLFVLEDTVVLLELQITQFALPQLPPIVPLPTVQLVSIKMLATVTNVALDIPSLNLLYLPLLLPLLTLVLPDLLTVGLEMLQLVPFVYQLSTSTVDLVSKELSMFSENSSVYY